MADEESGYKWWLRYVLIPLVGGGGLVAVVVTAISRPGVVGRESSTSSGSQSSQAPLPEASKQQDPVADVEKLVAKWLAALMNGRMDEVVALASEPFYFDRKVILTKPELRAALDESRKKERGGTRSAPEIESIKVHTARELQGSGHDLSKDRIFRSLNLTLDAYVALITARGGEGMIVVVRQVGDRYEVVGVWD